MPAPTFADFMAHAGLVPNKNSLLPLHHVVSAYTLFAARFGCIPHRDDVIAAIKAAGFDVALSPRMYVVIGLGIDTPPKYTVSSNGKLQISRTPAGMSAR
jgi:hypothetical protein